MTQKTAKWILMFFNLISTPTVGYTVYVFYSNYTAINAHKQTIPMDSGTYYLLLMSLFWLLAIIQYMGQKNERGKRWVGKYAGATLIFWFIGNLILANLLPYYLQNKAENLGYIKCDDPREINRTARGASYIFTTTGCADIRKP